MLGERVVRRVRWRSCCCRDAGISNKFLEAAVNICRM